MTCVCFSVARQSTLLSIRFYNEVSKNGDAQWKLCDKFDWKRHITLLGIVNMELSVC